MRLYGKLDERPDEGRLADAENLGVAQQDLLFLRQYADFDTAGAFVARLFCLGLARDGVVGRFHGDLSVERELPCVAARRVLTLRAAVRAILAARQGKGGGGRAFGRKVALVHLPYEMRILWSLPTRSVRGAFACVPETRNCSWRQGKGDLDGWIFVNQNRFTNPKRC